MTITRPLAKVLVSVAALVALAVPAALALAMGWIEIYFTAWGEKPGPDPTPIESWVLLALSYVVWTPLVFVVLVVALDRLGYKYTPVDRAERPTRQERRRRTAGLKYLQSQEAPPAGAPGARPKRGAASSSSAGGSSSSPVPPSSSNAGSGREDGD